MELSVVIPTFNRLGRLRRVLTALENQTVPLHSFEVVVVSDGSSDGTDVFLRQYQTLLNLRVVTQANKGVAAARNNGFAHAVSDLVLFIDDDVVPQPTLLAEHIRLHREHDRPIVVLGPMITPADFVMQPWVRWEQAKLQEQYDAMAQGLWKPTARQFYTGNTSIQRQFLVSSGGFDERFRRAEDVELAFRLADLGLQFVFHPQAVGYHYAERSYSSWENIPYTYGRNDVIFSRDKGHSWLLPVVFREFHERRTLIQAMVHLCLDRPTMSKAVIWGLRSLAWLADKIQFERLTQVAYSGIFNLKHYQGVADELGGRRVFFRQIEPPQPLQA